MLADVTAAAILHIPLGARWSLNCAAARRILGGTIDIFARCTGPERGPGPLLHVGRFEAGAVIFPVATEGSGLELIAAVTADSECQDADIDSLAGDRTDDSVMLAGLLDRWIATLADGLGTREQPPGQRVIEVGASHDLIAGQIVSLKSVGWLDGEGAGLSVLRETGRRAPRPDVPLVLSPLLWALVTDAGRVRHRATGDVLASLGLVVALGLANALLTELIAARLAARDVAAAHRRAGRVRQDEVARASSIAAIATVVAPDGDIDGAAEPGRNPLAAALQLIGRHSGFSVIDLAPEQESLPLQEKLSVLVASSHLRLRQVALRADVWRWDGMPLLVFDVDDRPLVALSDAAGRWCLIEPATSERRDLDAGLVAQLAPRAFVVYRPLPSSLTPWRVARFTLSGSGSDLWQVVSFSALAAALALVAPIVTGVIVDEIIPNDRFAYLGQMVTVLAAVAIGTALFELARVVALVRIEARGSTQLQAGVWDRVMRLPTSFFRDFSVGDLAMRIFGVELIRHQISGVAVGALLGGVFSMLNLLLMLYLDWRLGLLVIVCAVVAVGGMLMATRAQLRHLREAIAAQGVVTGAVVELLTGIAKLRVAAAEDRAFRHWAESFAVQQRSKYHSDTWRNRITVAAGLLPLLFAIVVFAAVGTREPMLDTGAFVAFSAALGQFLLGMTGLTAALSQLLSAVPLYERLTPLLEAVPEVSRAAGTTPKLAGAIEVNSVSFRYALTGPPVLDGVSCRIQPGEFIAFVGPSGSGKSTLLRILLGFETPSAGTVYYDERDLSRLDTRAVRRQLGVVLQDAKLSPGTIFENIVGASGLGANEAMDAVRMAGMEADIAEMPMGLQTYVAEGAGTLSGGQRQRLMIARALVRRPTILLFDEATSALDNETQAIVSRSVEGLNVTRIVIAHRLSTIRHADRIYVMQAGRMVQQGGYAQLISEPGAFRALAERQIA